MVYTYHSFLIHSSADGHLGCFHVLAIINFTWLLLSRPYFHIRSHSEIPGLGLQCVVLFFSHSVVSDSFVIPCTVALQAPLSVGFSRQEHWSGLPFPSLGHLPDPGIEPLSPGSAGGFFTTGPPGKPVYFLRGHSSTHSSHLP